jgi:UDP-N-acetylglucosamine 2-epimerase (non-hydrolysing)
MVPSRQLVVHVVGARPNYMKVAPLYADLERRGRVDQRLIHTGQHYDHEMNDVFFSDLPLPKPHYQLAVGSGSHAEQTARALVELERLFDELRPDLVVVPGDVNSTLAAALAAVKLNIPVCHLEAGLRSFDTSMPEEHNRRLTDHVSALLLTHSEDANANLAAEGITAEKVAFVGNTMIDTLLAKVEGARKLEAWRQLGLRRRHYVLVTLHRPALVDDDALVRATMRGLETIAREIPVVFPVHPRTRARLQEAGIAPHRINLTGPLAYTQFLSLQTGAAAVVTDSGGIQEETTALGIPCFTLRDRTERPVTVTHGTNVVLGMNPAGLEEIPRLLDEAHPSLVPPLWDGQAGRRAGAAIVAFLRGQSVESASAPPWLDDASPAEPMPVVVDGSRAG